MESRCLSLNLVFLCHPLSLARVLKASADKFSESFFAWPLSRPVTCLQLLHCPLSPTMVSMVLSQHAPPASRLVKCCGGSKDKKVRPKRRYAYKHFNTRQQVAIF